jgi:hypothetical protein
MGSGEIPAVKCDLTAGTVDAQIDEALVDHRRRQ